MNAPSDCEIDSDENKLHDTVIDSSVNPCCWLLSCPLVHCGFCPYSTLLILKKEEVQRKDSTLFGERTSLRSYGELGHVELGHCCCFVCVDSNLGPLTPGFVCDKSVAEAIVKELQERMENRGDRAQIQMSEKILEKTIRVNEKIALITKHLNATNQTLPPSAASIEDR